MRKFVSLLILVLAASSVFAAPATNGGARRTARSSASAPVHAAASAAATPAAPVSATSSAASAAPIGSTVSAQSTSVSSTTATSADVVKKVDSGNKDYFQIGLRVRAFNGLNTNSQLTGGFEPTSSDQSGKDAVRIQLSLQAKFKRFAIEYLPLENTRALETKFYGSSLGGVTLTTSNVILGKFFPIDEKQYSVSVGVGIEHNMLGGNGVSMGGFVFPTDVNSWSPVFQFGGQYYLHNRISIGFDYERSNARVTTKIPGVPDLVTTWTDRMDVRLMLGVF
jgi:hypothetical protein